jgi:hypothetical protein
MSRKHLFQQNLARSFEQSADMRMRQLEPHIKDLEMQGRLAPGMYDKYRDYGPAAAKELGYMIGDAMINASVPPASQAFKSSVGMGMSGRGMPHDGVMNLGTTERERPYTKLHGFVHPAVTSMQQPRNAERLGGYSAWPDMRNDIDHASGDQSQYGWYFRKTGAHTNTGIDMPGYGEEIGHRIIENPGVYTPSPVIKGLPQEVKAVVETEAMKERKIKKKVDAAKAARIKSVLKTGRAGRGGKMPKALQV